MEPAEEHQTTDAGTIAIVLALVVACPACAEAGTPEASGMCPACGAVLPADLVSTVREVMRRRRQAFKGRLSRLDERMHALSDRPLVFSTRGVPLSAEDHLTNILHPAINTATTRLETVKRLLEIGTWDPQEVGCIAAFTELVRTLDESLTAVTTLCETMPPIEWRAVHRELARAVLEQARGQIQLAMTISAPDAVVAQRLTDEGTAFFSTGAQHAARITKLIELIRHSPADGPFEPDGSLDIAALAWSSVSETSTSIADSANLVRQYFAGVPGVPTLADEYAVSLLPLLASGARVVDNSTLVERARLLRNALDTEDASGGWIVDPSLLIARVRRGLDRIVSETERMGREWRYGLPRAHIMNSLSEVYRQLVEGALRDLGGVIVVAGRASRGEDNAAYEQEVIDGIQAGDVVTEFQRMGAPIGGALDMLYRNASAHADIEVTDTGIAATERAIENGRVASRTTTTLSDAEFFEEVIALQEILLALQLALVPWLSTHPNAAISGALASGPSSRQSQVRILRLLAGIAGLREVRIAIENDHVTIHVGSHPAPTEGKPVLILSVVPAAFGAELGATEVTLDLTDLRPVTFATDEFVGSDTDGTPHGLTQLGLTTAKWLVASGMPWSERDEATYVSFPLTRLHFECAKLVVPPETENIDRAVESLRLIHSRLAAILPSERRSLLTLRIVEQLSILESSLVGLTESRRGKLAAAEGQRFAQQAADTLDVVYKLQEEAKALRDRTAD